MKHGNDEYAYLREELSPWDQKLWFDFLKMLPFHIKRNVPIEDIDAQFFSQAMGVIIETYDEDSITEEEKALMAKRDEIYKEYDFRVCRISKGEIFGDFDAVKEKVLAAFGKGYSYSY